MDGERSAEVLDALREVIDPEIGVNVVDLGLVHEAGVAGGRARVVMTMTTPACPLGASMADEARAAIRRCVPGVTSVAVELVSEPRWAPSMMSTEARRQLGLCGARLAARPEGRARVVRAGDADQNGEDCVGDELARRDLGHRSEARRDRVS